MNFVSVYGSSLLDFLIDVKRSDHVDSPGLISLDIVNRLIKSDLVIADITDLNPNVFYELAIRNAVKKPVIIIKTPDQKVPFDIYDKRAISLDITDPQVWIPVKRQLKTQIIEAEKDPQIASHSILSNFGFQLESKKTTHSEINLQLQIKNFGEQIKQLRNEIRSTQNLPVEEVPFEEIPFQEYMKKYGSKYKKLEVKLGKKCYNQKDSIMPIIETKNFKGVEIVLLQVLDPVKKEVFKTAYGVRPGWASADIIKNNEIRWSTDGTYTIVVTARDGTTAKTTFKFTKK